jgi:hypothetical protein
LKLGTYTNLVDPLYVIVIGDLHIGDSNFNKESKQILTGYINWVKERDNAVVFLNGDVLNVATRASKTSPASSMSLDQELDLAKNLFSPIKDKIIGAIDGNHEERMVDYVGLSPTVNLCYSLGVPYYGNSAVIKFQVGSRMRGSKEDFRVQYIGYFHHTTGGGATVGAKLNRVDKLRQLFMNADFYAGSHNHMLGVMPTQVPMLSKGKIVMHRQMLVDCGGYLSWDGSYAEHKQLPPLKMGSPRIRLNGSKRDIHVEV